MAERHFTPEEANARLEQVRPAAESLVAHRRAFLAAGARREGLASRIAGNGGDLDPQEPSELDAEVEREAEEVLLCWQVGEDEIAYWHGLDDGFAGRKPLPLD